MRLRLGRVSNQRTIRHIRCIVYLPGTFCNGRISLGLAKSTAKILSENVTTPVLDLYKTLNPIQSIMAPQYFAIINTVTQTPA